MSKSVLISIQPKWCDLIASGEKTVEVRKTRPKLESPFKCYIYKTKKRRLRDIIRKDEADWLGDIAEKTRVIASPDYNGGWVIGEFVCDWSARIETVESYEGKILESSIGKDFSETALTKEEIINYAGRKFKDRTDYWVEYLYGCYGWHISDLKIYDKPKELGEFWRPCPNRSVEKILDCAVGIKSCKYKTKPFPFQCTANLQSPPQSWCYVEE